MNRPLGAFAVWSVAHLYGFAFDAEQTIVAFCCRFCGADSGPISAGEAITPIRHSPECMTKTAFRRRVAVPA